MLLLIILLFLEAVILIVAGGRFFVKYFGFMKRGDKFKQPKLSNSGRMIGFIGLFIVVGIPRILGVRDVYSVRALSIYLLIGVIGVCLIIMSLQFMLAAYKTEEETPNWIKKMTNFWK